MKNVGLICLLLLCWVWNSAQAKDYIFWKYPAMFSDFSLSVYDDEDDLKYLIDEFERFARPAINRAFPEDDYNVFILIENIDMAGRYVGDVDLFLGTIGGEDIRVVDNDSSAVLKLQYEIRDMNERVLASGKYRKRMQRILPINFYVGPKKQFPYIAELFEEWLMQAQDEVDQTLASE